MAIRLFFLLLVLANLLFFAWTQGYLGAPDNDHEPLRLAQQLHPEKLRIVRQAQMPAVKNADLACRVIGGLRPADAEALKTAIEATGATAKLSPLREPGHYIVVIADIADKAMANRKAIELTRLGIEGYRIVELEDGRHEIILGRFESEPAAQEFMQKVTERGVKSARLDGREPPVLKVLVEMRAPSSTLLSQLPKLIGAYADATVGECTP